MFPSLAHLPDAAGTPLHMGLGVDEDWWAGRVAIGNPLDGKMVDIMPGDWKSMRLALPKREDRGAPATPSAWRRDSVPL
jgi:hypothetical protein